MAKNFVAPGEVLEHTAGGTITSGQVVKVGDSVGIALGAAASGGTVSVRVAGRFTVAKVAGTAWDQGDKVSWDASATAFGKGITPAAGDVIGVAYAATGALSAATTADIVLANPGTAE